MNINLYTLTAWLTTITAFWVGILVYLKNPKVNVNKRWFFMSLSITFWSLFLGLMFNSKNPTSGLVYSKILMIGANLIPITFYHFILAFLDKENEKKERKLLTFGYGITIFLLIISSTSLIVASATYKNIVRCFYPDAGPFLSLHILLYFGFSGYACLLMHKATSTLIGQKKNQVRYVLFASIVGFLGGGTTFPLWYQIQIPPIGSHFVWLYTLTIAYAIVKHRLMDIRLAITRLSIFSIVYIFVLGIPFWVGYASKSWIFSTWLAVALATLGPFIYIRLEKRSKEILYKIEFKRYETLRRLSKTLLLIKDLDKLVELIVYRLVKTLKVTYAAIYLYDKEKDAYALKSCRPLIRYSNAPNEEILGRDNPLIKLLLIWKKELIQEELKNLPIYRNRNSNNPIFGMALEDVQVQMQKISATLAIPHFLENDLLGFLVLGDKEMGTVYTEEDISILSALANSAALAIENSMFLIDLKITQAELFNAKRIADLGYMASAMGHEINNRLQAIYAAAFDMTDNPAIVDIIKNNPQAKALFEKDIHHINENVDDATAIINELKIYGRPQETKQNFVPVDLNDVIDKAITVVRLQSIKAFDMIDLYIEMPDNLPKVTGNFIQLQQVFVNILNNAYDAILEKKEQVLHNSSQPNIGDYKGNIKITIAESKNMLDIHIIDNGIGMTEEIKKRLFIPLFTSKTSSDRKTQREVRGGTGIGLYTIQTIIKAHDGTITIHDTNRSRGTDFLIRLPVAK